MRIYHNSRNNEYRAPYGAVEVSTDVKLALRVESEVSREHIKKVQIRFWQDEIGEMLADMPLAKESVEGSCTTRTAMYEITANMPGNGGVLWYSFRINVEGPDGEYTVYYGNNDNRTGGEGVMKDSQPESFQITIYRHEDVPEWFKDGIVYQIFPDRFARDEKWRERCEAVVKAEEESGHKGQKKTVEEDWYKPAYYGRDEQGAVLSWPFYGGSFKGIQEKLDYLTSMGVSAIYLNPIFKASSNHRYDTCDYMKADPMLGTEEEFSELAEAAREKGIRLILDGAFSHVGADSIYFDKYGNYGDEGAYNNPESDYRNWFEFRGADDPVGYRCWWGIGDLPEINETEEDYINLICGNRGVLAKWLRAGASGFRLDVADELPDSFIAEVRKRLKKESPDNLLIGEVWEDASNKISYGERRKYFMGDELDSTMNYPLRTILLDWVQNKVGSAASAERLLSIQENYPRENFYGALNLIGSHDRERVLTAMGAEQNYDNAVARVKLLSVLQYCLPGVPCIYYGDEAGMTGDPDPLNRNGFVWDKENTDMQLHYRQLGVLYKEHPVLKNGELELLDVGSEDVIAFLRTGEDEKILVLANRSDEAVVVSNETLGEIRGAYALELLSSGELLMDDGHIDQPIVLKARSAAVVCIRDSAPSSYDMEKGAGVICHLSSIPGGKLGAPARAFVDYLHEAGMSLWQVLPLNPAGIGGSPYSSNSAFAGDTKYVNYDELPSVRGYWQFYEDNRYWLDDYVNYLDWKSPLSDEDKANIVVTQYYFAVQWDELKQYANSKGIKIIGDLPVFVSADSADVWANRSLFQIDEDGRQKCHAGVPPDYFSPEGQDWGNPLYDWDAMKATGYDWWIKRLDQCRQRYDYVRMDHFRSFSEYFAIPEGCKPVKGRWQKGPGLDFYRAVSDKLGGPEGVKILAEDLGQLDAGVTNLLKLTGLPGMNVWQFSADEVRHMTAAEISRRVIYTGTHDNQTLKGWCDANGKTISDALEIIREMYASDAPWVMMQFQDLFMLDDEARMNVPGVAEGNWTWQIPGDSVEDGLANAETIAAAFRNLGMEFGRFETPEVRDFLKRHGMHCADLEILAILDDMEAYYRNEIDRGDIPGILYRKGEGERRVIAVDMGGTNIRVARVVITDSGVSLEKMIRSGMPGRKEPIDVHELFDMLASMVVSVDRDELAEGIGFSFSFPGEPTPEGDMTILAWDKEIKVTGSESRRVGSLLQETLIKNYGQKPRRVIVINDTVATLMPGLVSDEVGERNPCVAGLVIGTGENICVLDKVSGKIYNLESGMYPDFLRGDVDVAIDAASASPGTCLAEKMICGAYIQTLLATFANVAVKEGLVSQNMGASGDAEIMAHIERACVERAAAYSAITIATAIRLSGHRHGRCSVMAEGSVYWKLEGLKEGIDRYLTRIFKDTDITVDFVKVEDSSLLGAAAVAVK